MVTTITQVRPFPGNLKHYVIQEVMARAGAQVGLAQVGKVQVGTGAQRPPGA